MSILKNNQGLLAAIAKAAENKTEVSEAIPQKRYLPKLEEGVFIAVVIEAIYEKNQSTNGGFNNRVRVKYEVIRSNDENENVEMMAYYWETPNENSLYVRHLSVLLGRDSRDGFTLNELVGEVVEIVIVHNETERGTFANIEQIKPVDISQLSSEITI